MERRGLAGWVWQGWAALLFHLLPKQIDDQVGQGAAFLGGAEYQFFAQVRGDAEGKILSFRSQNTHLISLVVIPQNAMQCKAK